jgi:hypothetical protein
MYICHECGRDNSNNIPKAQDGVETPFIPYSNEYLDNSERDYLKLYNDPNTRMDDGFDAFYHSMVDSLPDVTRKAKGWVEYKPGTDIEEFTEDDGSNIAPIPGKNRMVKRVEDYELSDRPDTTQQGKLASYMQKRAINKLDKRTVSNKGYDTDIPKQKNGGWLDNYGTQENYNDSQASAPEGMVGDGFSNVGRNYSPAWGGQFQMGGNVYPVNYIPQAQNGNKKKKKGVVDLLRDAEDSVNKSLGYPMGKAHTAAEELAAPWYNPKTKQWEENDPVDNFRHPMAGRYTSEAIQDKLYNIPILSQIAGMVGSNALGIGHELSTLINPKDKRGWYDKIREFGEDTFNNAVGATVGSLPISGKAKTNMLVNLSNKNMIPDGVSGKGGDMYIKHAMGGSIPGTPGFTYARTQGIPSEGPYAKKTMASAQVGKKIKIKDERGLVMKPAESTSIKRKDFNLTQSKDNKAYINAVARQKAEQQAYDKSEIARKRLMTPKQIEHDDYVRSATETITQSVPETTWERAKAIVSNPMTAIGYKVRGENLPGRFQYGPRNEHDYAVDWINPLQSAAALSNIPGQLGRGEFLDAGLSALDAVDLGIMAKGLKKVGTNQLRNLSPAIGYRNGGEIEDYPEAQFGRLIKTATSAKKLIKPIKKTLAKGALKTLEEAKKVETLGKEVVKKINDDVVYPIKYRKQIANVKDLHNKSLSDLQSEEAVKRLSGVLGIDVTKLDLPSITTRPRIGSHYNPRANNINIDFRQLNELENSEKLMLPPETVYQHELGHWMQREGNRHSFGHKQELENYEKQLAAYNSPSNQALKNKDLTNATPKELDDWFNNFVSKPSMPRATAESTVIDRFAQQLYGYDKGTNMINIDAVVTPENIDKLYPTAKYFTNRGVEPFAHLREMRQNMLNKGYIKDKYEPISQETINKFISENPTDRVSSFTIPSSNQTKGLESIFRNLPSVIGAGAVGTAAYKMQNQEQVPGMRGGGIIDSDRGQWDYPGEITRINSNEITMGPDPKTGKPLTKPLLGISDTGDVKLMRPGGNYKFDGKRVTEYPIAQSGLTMGTTSTENDVRESSAQSAKANTKAKKQAKLEEAQLLAEQAENRRNLFARDIKVRQPDGTILIVNTGSPEYEELYKAGEIQSPGAGEDDNPLFGGELPEVVLQQEMTPLLQAKRDYGFLSNKEAFVNRKKDEYIKSLGTKNNWFGADRNTMPENVLRDIEAEYKYNQNTKAIEDVARAKGFDLNTRGNWIYNLTPSEREALINSKYSAQLNPNEFAEMASGVQQLANTMTPGKIWNLPIPGLTQRELEEDRESSLSALKVFSPFNIPGNLVANYLKNSEDYVENPFIGMQRMGNVDVWDSMAMNPLNLPMITGAANLITKAPGAISNTASAIGKGANLAIENAPAAMNFAKDAVKDVRGVVKQYKEIGKIKNQDDYYNSVVNSSKYIDDLPKTGINASNTITNVNELYDVITTLSNNYKSYLKRMGGDEFANAEADKWKQSFVNTDLAKRLEDAIDYSKPMSVDEYKQLGRDFSNSFPEGKGLIGPAKKALTKVQKNIIFNKEKDYETIKEFAKNLKIKIPKRPDKVEYSPKERETIDAIRELGKYKSVAYRQKDKLLADPEAMVNINKVILKLDDDVIENLLKIPKSELLNRYKNIVPSTKKTQVDITSNPIPIADLSLVNEQNLVQPSGISDIHPLNEKQLLAPELKYQTLTDRIGQSYAKNFEPVNYEKPSSYPQDLIFMAKTDYQYKNAKDAAGNYLFDAYNNPIEKLVPEGNVKQQLIGAVRKVQASPKGSNWVGSSSLSTDSYPLTLDAGVMMSEKGLVDVGVDTGTMYLNDMGYTHESPGLVIKDINSKIEQLEKLSGKKLPRAKYDPKADRYRMYQVPRIYFTRLKQGGSINKADENSLVKLDQLTNFTNYNKPQPGGWLSKYE